MRPIFTIHAGEYLVADYLERHYKTPDDLRVWVPSKDNGIDLLVTSSDCRRSISLQVKFSKSHGCNELCEAMGWWNIGVDKLKQSSADYWVLVLPTSYEHWVEDKCSYIILSPRQLSERLQAIKSRGENAETDKVYLWIKDSTAIATRGTRKRDLTELFRNPSGPRNFSCFLNAWDKVLTPILNRRSSR